MMHEKGGLALLAEQYDVFLLDLDGVVYIGRNPLPGAKETIERLRKEGKQVYFVTNDPVPTRSQIARRLQDMGIAAQVDEIVSCGWATAQYLRNEGIKSAYLLGSEGLKRELEQEGISVLEGHSVACDRQHDVAKNHGHGLRQDRATVDAVVVGWNEKISFQDIQQAARLINQGARFIATNADTSFPAPEGPLPATGAIVKAIEVTVDQTATIVGKPFPLMFKTVTDQLSSDLRAVMIGDNPDTDILGAHQAGLPAFLIAEQKNSPPVQQDEDVPANLRRPDAILSGLADLYRPLS